MVDMLMTLTSSAFRKTPSPVFLITSNLVYSTIPTSIISLIIKKRAYATS